MSSTRQLMLWSTQPAPAPVEEWRPVAGWDGYEISSLGRLRSWRVWLADPAAELPRTLVGGHDRFGYRRAVLCAGPERRSCRITHLVAAAFLGPRPDGHVIRHLDGNRINDCASNLIYGTQRENMADKRKHGTSQEGERHARALPPPIVWKSRLTPAETLAAVLDMMPPEDRGGSRRCPDKPFKWQAVPHLAERLGCDPSMVYQTLREGATPDLIEKWRALLAAPA